MKKPRYGLVGAIRQCARYRRMDERERRELREGRVRRLVAYARERSPYYAERYAGVAPDAGLQALPPTDKLELMARWDDWLTDRTVKLADVYDFMRDDDNIGRKLMGKYLVLTTSGSTGNPLVALCDDATNNVMGAINAARCFARRQDLRAFMLRGGKTIGVFATGGFYLGNSSVRARQRQMPWKRRQIAVTSALLPTERIVAELNAFQPAMLGGYPSSLELLIDERRSGRLHVSPVLIMTGGEHLSDELREGLSQAFGCYVQTSYSCTEGGTIACECEHRRFHVNDDWVVAEPVDADGRPVPPGERADKLLITNLFNYTQPYIRYEISDRVVMHDEPCPCGNPSPWLTLEGRSDDVVSFARDGAEVKLAPLAIYATLREVRELRRFQLLKHPDDRAELRIEPAEGVSREAAFAKASEALEGFLREHGVTGAVIELGADAPRQDAGSGKFKHIVRVGER